MALRILGTALSRLSLSSPPTRSIQLAPLRGLQNQLPRLVSPSVTSSLHVTARSASVTSPTAFTSQNNFAFNSLVTPTALYDSLLKTPGLTQQVRHISTSPPSLGTSLNRMHRVKFPRKKRKDKNPLNKQPFARGVVLKTLIKKPKKPNSANRKCVLVRLSSGKELVAFVPGEGHNLQEHNVVLVRPGRLRDVPGVKVRCVRGKYDLQHVVKKR